MANYLYRLTLWTIRRRGVVVALWVAVLAALAAGAAAFSGPVGNAFSIPGTESQRAVELLQEKFPGTGGASARVVVAAPDGRTLDEEVFQQAGRTSLDLVRGAPQVIAVTGFDQGTLSPDRRILYGDIQYAVPVGEVGAGAKEALEAAAQPARDAGLQVEFSGGIIASTAGEGGHSSEAVGIAVAFVVLAVTFGSLVAAGMPLLTALVGVAAGLLGIQVMTGVVELSATTPTLALMLGLAVGIDYALFILSRHRQQLREGMEVRDSVATATATAGGAVVFAGVTVVIALVGLALVGIPFLTQMGVAAAATVAVAVLVSVTLLPALLALLGTRVGAGSIGFVERRQHRAGAGGRAWSRVVTARPLVTVVLCVGAVAALAWPALQLQLGLPDDGTKPESTTERRAYDLLAQGFGPGFNGPLTLVVHVPGRTDAAALTAQAIADAGPQPGVAVTSPPVPNPEGDVAIVSVIPTTAPGSEQTRELVDRIRAVGAAAAEQGAQVYVTGPTASNIDVSEKLASALPVFLAFIVVLAFLLLVLVFRSILVPLKAIAGFLLSLAAALGVVVAVFQQGHLASVFDVQATGPIVSFLPVLLIGILFGLAMDYEVFLVSRVREDYVHTGDPARAVELGMAHSGRVVTAAALIMVSVFGAFIFGGDAVIKAIGLALAVGVAVDAFVVRMTLVPAVLALLGHSAWALPGWLDRALPDLDVEGAKLARPGRG